MSKKATATYIKEECAEIAQFLCQKNRGYGDSFSKPLRVFSDLSALDQINLRIDDKLSRLVRGNKTEISEDTELDLIGYLILKRVLRRMSCPIANVQMEKDSCPQMGAE